MFDKENDGTINITEFQALYNYINAWLGVFRGFDHDYGFYAASDDHPGKDVNPDRDTFRPGGVYKSLKPMEISFAGMTLGQNARKGNFHGF